MNVGYIIRSIESLGNIRSRLSDAAKYPDEDNNIKINARDAAEFAVLLDEEVKRLKSLEVKGDEQN